MTNTRVKLNEAKYFLVCMINELANRDPFKYNLSAFLSAGRSVTCFMQKEYNTSDGFKEWYGYKQKTMNDDSLFKFMNDKRVMTIHKKPVDPRGHVRVVLSAPAVVKPSVSIKVIRANGTEEYRKPSFSKPPIAASKPVKIEYEYYFENISDKNVVALAQEYVSKLDSLVGECESKFAV